MLGQPDRALPQPSSYGGTLVRSIARILLGSPSVFGAEAA